MSMWHAYFENKFTYTYFDFAQFVTKIQLRHGINFFSLRTYSYFKKSFLTKVFLYFSNQNSNELNCPFCCSSSWDTYVLWSASQILSSNKRWLLYPTFFRLSYRISQKESFLSTYLCTFLTKHSLLIFTFMVFVTLLLNELL